MFNYRYAKIVLTGDLEYAEAHPTIDGRVVLCPTEAQYNELGYYAVVNNPPEPPTGYHVASSHYEKQSNQIVTVYTYEQDVPIPRRWTQLKIETALGIAGKSVDAFHEILKGIELWSGYTVFRAYDIADYIEEFYPNAETWNIILDGIAQAAGKTRAELDAFLDTIPTEA